jgi:hypothetical protein
MARNEDRRLADVASYSGDAAAEGAGWFQVSSSSFLHSGIDWKARPKWGQ